MPDHLSDQTTLRYEIHIAGRIDPQRAAWFEGFALVVKDPDEAASTTIFSVNVPDQSALFGILSQIRDLGLKLISVNRV